jgi:hypothetical protein
MAEVPPPTYPSGDFSYITEIVMGMQDTMGQLKEAVAALKEQSGRHGDKLELIGKDVHAAKVTMGVLSAVIVAGAALIGWIVTTYIAAHPAK